MTMRVALNRLIYSALQYNPRSKIERGLYYKYLYHNRLAATGKGAD